jgi:chromosome segregation ATPase
MGEENRNIALENHNIDKQVESYLRLYEDAIDSGLTGESFQTAGRELLFYQQAWRERSEIWKQLVQLDAENQRLKSELTSLQPRLKKLMEQLQQEKIRIEEQKRRLGLSDESPD